MSSLSRIAASFRKQNGARLNPHLLGLVAPGTIVEIDGGNDVDFRTNLATLGVTVPEPLSADVVFPDWQALRGVKFNAHAEPELARWIDVRAGADALLDAATTVRFDIQDEAFWTLDWFKLESALARGLRSENDALRRTLKKDDNHIVVGIYTGRIVVQFERAGAATFDLQAEARKVGAAELGAGWAWTAQASIISTTVRPFAFESARWNFVTDRLRDTSD